MSDTQSDDNDRGGGNQDGRRRIGDWFRDRADRGRDPKNRQTQAHLWYWVIALILIMLAENWWVRQQNIQPLPYSQFLTLLQDHKIAEVQVEGQNVTGKLKEKLPNGRLYFSTTRVPPELTQELRQAGVTFTGVVPNTFWTSVLGWIVPAVAFFALWWLFFRRYAQRFGQEGGMMAIGKSKAKIYVERNTRTRFADVAGADEAKDELKEIVDFLKDPKRYGRLGARVPRGVLLVGPPGTGKTLLARAVAGEAGVPFFSISGSEFVEMFVGVGAARVRDLFEQARAKAPAIVFIDELDALGRSRTAGGPMGGHDEKEQTLNQLLVEMDGFDPTRGVVLLAATNRPEILDPALLRAGRFDRQILVDRPDKQARIAILQLHLRKIKAGPDVTAETLAELTPGFTGADLANLVNEAALLATRRNATQVEMRDATEAVERVVAGLAHRNRLMNPKEREIVAWHEMGHALVALSIPGSEAVHKVSIIPRGVGALGYTMQRPSEDRFLRTEEELEGRMAVLLGGRAAERVVFDHVSTGASDDLQRVTAIARDMVVRYGMSQELGPVALERDNRSLLGPVPPGPGETRDYSDETARTIDRLVRDRVERAMERAIAILTRRRKELDTAARLLLERETLTEDDLMELVGKARVAA